MRAASKSACPAHSPADRVSVCAGRTRRRAGQSQRTAVTERVARAQARGGMHDRGCRKTGGRSPRTSRRAAPAGGLRACARGRRARPLHRSTDFSRAHRGAQARARVYKRRAPRAQATRACAFSRARARWTPAARDAARGTGTGHEVVHRHVAELAHCPRERRRRHAAIPPVPGARPGAPAPATKRKICPASS